MSMSSEPNRESASQDALAASDTYSNASSNASGKKRGKSFKKIRRVFGRKVKNKNRDSEMTPEERSIYTISETERVPQNKIPINSSFDDEKKPSLGVTPSPLSTVDTNLEISPKKKQLADGIPASHEDMRASFQIILLLMDPETRRFELFHLDFESSQISVSEVLAQSSESITADLLQKVTYTAMTGSDGMYRSGTDLLSSFCIGNDVLVGIPANSSAEQIVQLATPILVDKTIVQMISDSGADISPWKKNLATSGTPSIPVRNDQKPACDSEVAGSRERQIGSTSSRYRAQPVTESQLSRRMHVIIITIELLFGLFLLYQFFMNSGQVAIPATGLETCDSTTSPIGYTNQTGELLFSCIKTCVDKVMVPQTNEI